MKTALFVLFLTLSALAQNVSTWPAACGPRQTKFDVNHEPPPARNPLPIAPAGKARIYFIQNTMSQVNVGIDGTWVGANDDSSWFVVAVDPGKHHICEYTTKWNIAVQLRLRDIDAQPGESYYLFAYVSYTSGPGHGVAPFMWELENIEAYDGDQLITEYPLAVFQEKKPKVKKKPAPVN